MSVLERFFYFFKNFAEILDRKKSKTWSCTKIVENLWKGVFLDADSEYRVQKIVRSISRELSPIFEFFQVVKVFESTQTPLEVHFLQKFFRSLDLSEPQL